MKYAPISKKLFVENRQRFASSLKPRALAILNANDIMPTNADGTMTFRQNSDLFYLSGVDQEESILVIYPEAPDEKHREILFLKETSELIAIWDGQKLTKEAATEVSGVKTVFWLSEFDRVFPEMMSQVERVYLNTNEHPRAATEVETRDMRFLKQCQARYPLHSYERCAPLIYSARMCKSPIEIDLIRQACDITESGFRRILEYVKPGVHEYEIEAEYIHEFVRQRSRGFAYGPIIGTGANACVLHYLENHSQCQDGEMLLMDVAAEYANYASDMTRTIPVNGKFTDRQKAVYSSVLKVMRACAEMLRPGVIIKEYQEEVNKMMEGELIDLGLLDRTEVEAQDPDKPLYKKYFMHGVSHHMGLDVHDVGMLHQPVPEGSVFTIEPGIYIREENLGIRLENNYYLGKDGNVDLMATIPVEIEEIEELMAK